MAVRQRPSLKDVASFALLRTSALRAARGHRKTPAVARFLVELESNVLTLERELLTGSYMPRPLRTFRIYDPKPRLIAAAEFRDRVVHHAVCAVLQPFFEQDADDNSFACRHGKGNFAAIKAAQRYARIYPRFVKLDIRHFFETVPHSVLKRLLTRYVFDPALLALIGRILDAGAASPGIGLPIGNLTSQHFGNAVLGIFDQYARRSLRVGALVRYMDDILLFGRSSAEVRHWSAEAELWVEKRLGMAIKAERTLIAPTSLGIPYLGFRVFRSLIRLDAARRRRLRRRLRMYERQRVSGYLTELEAQQRVGATLAWAEQAHSRGLLRALIQ